MQASFRAPFDGWRTTAESRAVQEIIEMDAAGVWSALAFLALAYNFQAHIYLDCNRLGEILVIRRQKSHWPQTLYIYLGTLQSHESPCTGASLKDVVVVQQQLSSSVEDSSTLSATGDAQGLDAPEVTYPSLNLRPTTPRDIPASF